MHFGIFFHCNAGSTKRSIKVTVVIAIVSKLERGFLGLGYENCLWETISSNGRGLYDYFSSNTLYWGCDLSVDKRHWNGKLHMNAMVLTSCLIFFLLWTSVSARGRNSKKLIYMQQLQHATKNMRILGPLHCGILWSFTSKRCWYVLCFSSLCRGLPDSSSILFIFKLAG